ncbi:hypothetical protein ABZ016_10545 [Streptomyces sp. NPDC006372]|uniref:hypothetical protein n=1 Tax=Streptomyces sp. NPDC006372 TaxID=3155599 RepID=UPI0033AB3987
MGAEGEVPKPQAAQSSRGVRLLPWSTPEGKSSYLITDDRGGRVSRSAEVAEATQLDMGTQLLAHADEMLEKATEWELRFLAERLTEALRNTLRVAECRGQCRGGPVEPHGSDGPGA